MLMWLRSEMCSFRPHPHRVESIYITGGQGTWPRHSFGLLFFGRFPESNRGNALDLGLSMTLNEPENGFWVASFLFCHTGNMNFMFLFTQTVMQRFLANSSLKLFKFVFFSKDKHKNVWTSFCANHFGFHKYRFESKSSFTFVSNSVAQSSFLVT